MAMCNDIGEAAYLNSAVGAAFFEILKSTAPRVLSELRGRYAVETEGTGETCAKQT